MELLYIEGIILTSHDFTKQFEWKLVGDLFQLIYKKYLTEMSKIGNVFFKWELPNRTTQERMYRKSFMQSWRLSHMTRKVPSN